MLQTHGVALHTIFGSKYADFCTENFVEILTLVTQFIFYSKVNVNFDFRINRLIPQKGTKKISSSFLVNKS